MNKDKVYLKGYVIGRAADTLGYEGLMVQLENLDVVEIDKNLVHRDINGPQKTVVPWFVADFITEQKKLSHTLSYSIDACMSDGVAEWYWDNSELFARAWLDGYEIEKEKRYLVKIIGITNYNSYLNYHKRENKWTIESCMETDVISTKHTIKELDKAGFGWVFDCPGIEIEEVN